MNKYKILDEVFYLHDNKVYQGKVLSVKTGDYGSPEKGPLYYDLSIRGLTSVQKREDQIFSTKEELLKSL